jgi:acylglycerol lipase
MQFSEKYLQSTDGTLLYFRSWVPDDNVRAVICFVHGIGEHTSRYSGWASMFCEQNIAFLTLDYRGHGLAEGKRGHVASFEQYFDDVQVLISTAAEIFPQKPLLLYGHSMGGNIVLNFYMKRKPDLKALIVTSPWIKLAKRPSNLVLNLARVLKKVYPSMQFKTTIKSADITHDTDLIKTYSNDPLIHSKISVSLFVEAFYAGKKLMGLGYKIHHPLLLMHGSADKITSCKGSEHFARNTGNYLTLKIWDGLYHELHNEPNKQEVFDFIIQWLNVTLDKNLDYGNI